MPFAAAAARTSTSSAGKPLGHPPHLLLRRGRAASREHDGRAVDRRRPRRRRGAPSRPRGRKFSGSPSATPEPPTTSGRSAHGRADRAQVVVVDRVGDGVRDAARARSSSSRAPTAAAPRRTTACGTSPTAPRRSGARGRGRGRGRSSASAGGGPSTTPRAAGRRRTGGPGRRVRPFVGYAGQTTARSAPSASRSASATGPMLPSGVESNVEQYLKKNCRAPSSRSHASAAGDSRDRLRDRRRARLQRDDDRVDVGQLEVRDDAERLDRPHPLADERAAEVGRAGDVVGDRAEERPRLHAADRRCFTRCWSRSGGASPAARR